MTYLEERIHKVVGRSRPFYRQTDPGHFLVNTILPYEAPPVPPLHTFDLDRQLPEWMDHKLDRARGYWHLKEGLDDDTLPQICPSFGIAEHSAWLGLDVRLQEDTCLSTPIIHTPSDLEKLRCSQDDPWYRYMKSGYEYLRSQQDGTFVLSVRGTMSPMDIANAVRGDALFLDFLTQPDFAHALLAVLVESVGWYYPQVCSWADVVAGGQVFTFEQWMPAGTFGHLSNDAAMLCSKDIYEQFGFPYEVEVMAPYKHVFFHVHNQKLHFVPRLTGLPHLSLLEVTNDPNTPAVLEDLARVLAATGSTNLMLTATSDQVRERLGDLESRNVFLRINCQDYADAEDVIAFVRDRSKPLDAAC